jgi:hypothetical protein
MSGTRRKPGPLGPCLEGSRAWLLGLGYSPLSVTRSLTALGHLRRWMAREDVDPDELDRDAVTPRTVCQPRQIRPLQRHVTARDVARRRGPACR